VEVRQTKDVVILDLKGRLTAGLGDQILRRRSTSCSRGAAADPPEPLEVSSSTAREWASSWRAQDGPPFRGRAQAPETWATASTARSTWRGCCPPSRPTGTRRRRSFPSVPPESRPARNAGRLGHGRRPEELHPGRATRDRQRAGCALRALPARAHAVQRSPSSRRTGGTSRRSSTARSGDPAALSCRGAPGPW